MFKRLFAFILCLLMQVQLGSFSKINFSLSLPTAQAITSEEECKSMSGKVWDSRLNACITTAENALVQDRIKNACTGLSGEEYNNCYYQSAMDSLGDKNVADTKEVKHGVAVARQALAATSTLLAASFLIKNGASYKCMSTSMKLITAAGALTAIGEVTTNITYKKNLKKDIEKYKKAVNPEASEDAEVTAQERIESSQVNQIEAFNFLINQEKSKKKALEFRGGTYAAAGALYLAAVVFTIIESAQMTGSGFSYICTPPASSTQDLKTPTPNLINKISSELYASDNHNYVEKLEYQIDIDILVSQLDLEIDQLLNSAKENDTKSFFEIAHSLIGMDSAYAADTYSNNENTDTSVIKEFQGILIGAGIGGAAVSTSFNKTLTNMFTTPITRGIYAGALGGYSAGVSADSFIKAKESKERIEAIEKIKKDIATTPATLSGCTTQDRKDSSKPECYCYIDGSEKNLQRQNQSVCQKQWGDYQSIAATDYNLSNSSTSSQGVCVTSTYQTDESCTCKSSTGKNTCLSLSTPNGFSAIGAQAWGNALTDMGNSIYQDTYGSGETLANTGNSLAMKAKTITDQLGKKSGTAKAAKAISSQLKKLNNANTNPIAKAFGVKPFNSPYSSTSALGDLDPKKAVEEVEKEIAKSAQYEEAAKKTAANSEESGYDLNFDTAGANGTTIDDVADVMDKNFDYGDNDINNRPQDSIFKILTMRYQTSGLRRLFDEKNEFKADKANETEIHGQQ